MIADDREDVVIQDTLHEVLELVPSIPRLQVLNGLLRGREYDEGHEDEDEMDVRETREDDGRPVSKLAFNSSNFTHVDIEDHRRNDGSLHMAVHERLYKPVRSN